MPAERGDGAVLVSCYKVGEGHRMMQRSNEDSSTEQLSRGITTRAELAIDRETRAASRGACRGITPPTVNEVLDLILNAARSKAPGEDGITTRDGGAWGWWPTHGASLATLVCRRSLAECLVHRVERVTC